MLPKSHVWIFSGAGGRFPGGVFSDLGKASAWIAQNKLTGVLTVYPLDEGCFDWALTNDCTNLSVSKQSVKAVDPAFVGSFTTASQEHYHFKNGHRSASGRPG